jgi:hypothetical protein
MDCQHFQQLLPFLDRPSQELDSIEQTAAMQHLANCPACSALAQTERRADQAIASVMRDVPVPADLQRKVLTRLAGERGGFPWKRATATALIAALLLVGLGVAWYTQQGPRRVTGDDLNRFANVEAWEKDKIERHFQEQGLTVQAPDDFNYEYLQSAEIVEFKGQRVAKLTFARYDGDAAIASVLILPSRQFLIDQVVSTQLDVRQAGGFYYITFPTRGRPENLKNQTRQ